MGFRKDLDLSQITKQYEIFRGVSSGVNYVKHDPDAPVTEWDPTSGVPLPPRQMMRDPTEEPLKLGLNGAEFSSFTGLIRQPLICWDANGYYRLFGVHWRATRKELRLAYYAINGSESVYATYVLKQLLHAPTRAAYDATRLGEPFLDDYVQDTLKANVAQEASKRSAEGKPTSVDEILDEMGYVLKPESVDEPDTPEPPQVVDIDPVTGKVLSDPGPSLHEGPEWIWGWYAWRSRSYDHMRLAQWQALLARELTQRGEITTLGVGFAGRIPHPYVLGQVENLRIVYLNDRLTPDEELAASAVTALLRDARPRQLPQSSDTNHSQGTDT